MMRTLIPATLLTAALTTYAGRTSTLEAPLGSAVHVRLDLGSRPACDGCKGWVRVNCPRAKECGR